PRCPNWSAWPVPTATTLTFTPDCFSNSGTRTSSSPLSCVLVVVARRRLSSGRVEPAQPASASSTRRMNSRGVFIAPSRDGAETSASVDHLTLHEVCRAGVGRSFKEGLRRGDLDQSAIEEQGDPLR